MRKSSLKRIIAGMAATAFMFSATPSASATNFRDIKATDWYYKYVTAMENYGYMNGVSSTSFAPNDTLTRAMFVTVLARIADVNLQNFAYQHSSFADVADNQWYTSAVCWATARGVTSGTTSTTFSPNDLVTREQMSTLISRYCTNSGIQLKSVNEDAPLFKDINSASSWAQYPIILMQSAGIILGDNTGNFHPQKGTSRAEAATVFYRLNNALNGRHPDDAMKGMAYKITDTRSSVYKDSVGTTWVQTIIEVTNTGTENIYLGDCSYELYNSSGNLVAVNPYISSNPTVLAPGERGYYYEETLAENIGTAANLRSGESIKVIPHISIKTASVPYTRYTTRSTQLIDQGYGSLNMIGTVTNTSAKNEDTILIIADLYDRNGKLLAQLSGNVFDLSASQTKGFSLGCFILPPNVTKGAVASYTVKAYPYQYQY